MALVAVDRLLHLLLAVEALRKRRGRPAEPHGPDHRDGRDDEADQAHPELLLREVDQHEDQVEAAEGPDRGDGARLDAVGKVDPDSKAEDHHRRQDRRQDHGVDRAPALLLPVDVAQVEPQRELIQRQCRADAEQDGEDLAKRRAGSERDPDVADDQDQDDAEHEVMDVGALDLDVARPPADVGADHVGAEAYEAEREQEGEQEEELRLLAGLDEGVPVGLAEARHREREAHGTSTTLPMLRRSAM